MYRNSTNLQIPFIGPEGQETINAAIEAYGIPAQLDMAVEEMAELTKAICKHKRAKDKVQESVLARENVIEEIADVYVMLAQLIKIFDGGDEVRQEVNKKLCRLKSRVEKATERRG